MVYATSFPWAGELGPVVTQPLRDEVQLILSLIQQTGGVDMSAPFRG
jgi:hypothetical protein